MQLAELRGLSRFKIFSDYLSRKLILEIGRNDPCPCESGKKYKKCCLLLEVGKINDEGKVVSNFHQVHMVI